MSTYVLGNQIDIDGYITVDGYFYLDGYRFNLNNGVVAGEILQYDGYSFVPVPETIVNLDNVRELQVATTSPTAIATLQPNASGNFIVYLTYRVANATTNVTIVLTWNDVVGPQTVTIVPLTAINVGTYTTSSSFINATTAAQIKIIITAGTANNVFASAAIVGVY